MNNKSEFLTGLVSTVVTTIAGATLIGGGTMVVTAQRDNAVQNAAIERIEQRQHSLDDTLQKLDKAVRDLDKNVAVLNERIQSKQP